MRRHYTISIFLLIAFLGAFSFFSLYEKENVSASVVGDAAVTSSHIASLLEGPGGVESKGSVAGACASGCPCGSDFDCTSTCTSEDKFGECDGWSTTCTGGCLACSSPPPPAPAPSPSPSPAPTPPPAPDLEARELVTIGTNFVGGDDVDIQGTVRNIGGDDTGPFFVRYEFDFESSSFTTSDFIGNNIQVNNLNPSPESGSESVTSFTLQNAPEGTHTVRLEADTQHIVDPDDRGNNFRFFTFMVGAAPAPDLEARELVTIGTNFVGGDDVEIQGTVRNIGGADTGPFFVRYEIDFNSSSFTTSDFLGDNMQVNNLNPSPESGSESVTSFTLQNAPEGTHTVRLEADTQHIVDPDDRGNNFRFFTFMVGAAPAPDLEARELVTIGTNFVGGDDVEIQGTVRNIGGADTGPFFVRYEIDFNSSSFTTSDFLGDNMQVNNLNPSPESGSESVTSFTLQNAPEGTHTVRLEADTQHIVDPDDRGNNFRSFTFTVDSPPTPACDDGADNDGDMLTDQDDPGCYPDGGQTYDPNDTDETNVAASVDISGNPTTVKAGEGTTITWTANNVTSCTVTGSHEATTGGNPIDDFTADAMGPFAWSDTYNATNINEERTYTISCQPAGGDSTDVATIKILPSFQEF